jgi:hypothetical protein
LATAASLGLRAGFVDDEVSVTEQPPIEHLDRLGGFFLGGHLHEAETARAPRELIGDDPDALDGTRLLKELPEILFCCLKR